MSIPALPQYFGKDLEAMSFAHNYHRWILDEIRPHFGNVVAEVGAGIGSFSDLILGSAITRLVSYEPSQNMFPALQARLLSDPRASAINGFFGAAGETEQFDTIIYVNVLEHIEDDAEELRRVHRALRPGGNVIIFVPALQWLYSNLDKQVGHFRRYRKRSLLALIDQTGFDPVKGHYFDFAGILPWYVNFVLLGNTISGKGVSLYDRLVVPVAKVFETMIRPPIGKNLLVVARKR